MSLSRAQYDAIMQTYQQRQFHNEQLLAERREEAYAKEPRLKAVHDEMASLSLRKAQSLLSGDENALNTLKAEITSLSAETKSLLSSLGLPEDYLEPIYDCPDCKDTGYIGSKKCHCFQKAIIDLLYTQSNLAHILTKENFDTFSFSYYSANHTDPKTGTSSLASIQKAYDASRDFVHTFGTDFRNLLFYGDTGVGKTFLSNCIAKELIDKSYSVIYMSAYKLFDTLAKERFEKGNSADQVSHLILDCDLLIIDDLGTELANSFTVSQMFLCVNERILRQKSTIISTNLSLEMLNEIYSERTFSRLTSNYSVLKLTGDDIRIKKKLMNREDISCQTKSTP